MGDCGDDVLSNMTIIITTQIDTLDCSSSGECIRVQTSPLSLGLSPGCKVMSMFVSPKQALATAISLNRCWFEPWDVLS